MTPLYLALMGLDPTSGKAELRQTNAGVDFLGGVHSAGDLTTGTTGSPANDRISEPAVRNWVLSLASSIVHLLQKPAASIVASYPAAQVEEEEESAAGEEEEETTPPPLATPSSTEPPANASTANGISLTTDTEDWAAHEALHHYPEAHRPRHKHRPSAGGLQPLPADAPRRRSLRSDAGNADGAPTVTVPVLQSSVDDSAVPYTYAQQANIGPDPATLAAFLHYNYPSFSMMHVPAKDYTGSSHVHGADDAALQHQRTPLKVQCIVRCRIPTEDNRGTFYLHYYINNKDGEHHMAIVYGDDLKSATLEADRKGETDFDRIARGAAVGPARQITDATGKPPLLGNTTTPANDSTPRPPPLVRIHSACFTGETVGSARCDCAEQLQEAMRQIQEEGRGVVVYLRQEGRGIGLADKMRWVLVSIKREKGIVNLVANGINQFSSILSLLLGQQSIQSSGLGSRYRQRQLGASPSGRCSHLRDCVPDAPGSRDRRGPLAHQQPH